jgi:hypothetical protein
VEDEVLSLPNLKRPVNGQEMKVAVPVELIALGLKERDEGGTQVFPDPTVPQGSGERSMGGKDQVPDEHFDRGVFIHGIEGP